MINIYLQQKDHNEQSFKEGTEAFLQLSKELFKWGWPEIKVDGWEGYFDRVNAKMISNDPRSYEEPSIAIYNASEQVGIASDENVKLTDEGYTISVTDNAPEGEYPTGTTIYAFTNKPGTKAMLEKLYNTSAVTGENIPASLPANYDFIIVLNPESEESKNN